MRVGVLMLLLASVSFQLRAQSLKVIWDSIPAQTSLVEELATESASFHDSMPGERVREQIRRKLREEGFWQSTIGISREDSTRTVSIYPGKKLHLGRISWSFSDSTHLPIKQKITFQDPHLRPQSLEDELSYFLDYYENHGHPFVQINIEEYLVEADSLHGHIEIDPGPYMRFDSIALKGFDGVSKGLLRHQLGYFKGKEYSEEYLSSLQEYVDQVEYLSFTRPPAVGFFKDKTTLYLYLQEQDANQIDGVVGLNTETDGTTSLNGDFQLRLLNTFNKGEDLRLRWRRPDESVQQLRLGIEWPFLINTPLSITTELEIFRQDSSFVNTELDGLLKYMILSRSYVSGGINWRSSNALLPPEEQSDAALQNLGSFNSLQYLFGTEILRTNRTIVPTKGYRIAAYGITGSRSNQEGERQSQNGWRLDGAHYWNIFQRIVLKSRVSSRAIFGEQLFENELYRLGGLQSLRGFNEQSIFASAYGMGSLEVRYMIGPYDYLAIFSDLAYVEKQSGNDFSKNWLTGIGAGMNIRTGGGIFSLFLAAGRSQSEGFDFRATKVHLGYINQF